MTDRTDPSSRDLAFAKLEAAGVIARAGFDDARGLPAYRLLGFPRGKKGVRLRALFDRHVKQAESDGHHDGPKEA